MLNFLKIYSLGFLLLISACQRCQIKKNQDINADKYSEVLSYALKNLPHQGKLVQQSDGFAYVKVDDAYIHKLFPMLNVSEQGYKEPSYFRRSDAPGAHISVFYENEHVKAEEAGQMFSFSPSDIKAIDVGKHDSYIILEVHAPALEELRSKYGLSPKLKGHEFHISLAKRSKRRDR